MKYANLREELVSCCRLMAAKGLVAGTEGNVSARDKDGTILMTPSGMNKGEIGPEMLVRLNLEGRVLEGEFEPTSERFMHLEFYRQRPDVGGVAHGHPIFCTAFAAAQRPYRRTFCRRPSNSLLEKNVPCYPHVVPGKHLALIGSQTGARLLEWFTETFVRVADSKVCPTALPIDKLTERIDDQLGDLMLLPYFAGSGSVRNGPAAKGALIGLTARCFVFRKHTHLTPQNS
jgi:L-ribulose-5-phosphate 4-epimerase